jgi:hypothetical protein
MQIFDLSTESFTDFQVHSDLCQNVGLTVMTARHPAMAAAGEYHRNIALFVQNGCGLISAVIITARWLRVVRPKWEAGLVILGHGGTPIRCHQAQSDGAHSVPTGDQIGLEYIGFAADSR